MINKDYLRNVVFGFEDGFVSSVGALAGIAFSNPGQKFLVISGLIIVSVEAFSMGIGSYLSEKSVHEISIRGHRDKLLLDGLFMWFAYITAGLITLAPYVIFSNTLTASLVSVSDTFIGLFLLGFIKGKVIHKHPLRSGLEMLMVAGFAVVIGYVVSELGQALLG